MNPDHVKAIEMFVMSIVSGFRVPNDSAGTAEHLAAMFFRHLEEFTPEVLDKARLHIERHRIDQWMPTVGECVRVCEHARDGKLRDLLDPEGAKKRAAAERELKAILGNRPLPTQPLRPRED